MSERTPAYDVGAPEPQPVDEEVSLRLRHLAEDAILRGRPNGDERCDTCLYYLEQDKDISYCWHPKLRILVGGGWWCQWWEEISEDADQAGRFHSAPPVACQEPARRDPRDRGDVHCRADPLLRWSHRTGPVTSDTPLA